MNLYGKYFNKYKIPFLIAVFCVISEAICDLLAPTFMANIINKGIAQGQISEVYHWGAIMLIVISLGAGFAVTRNIMASKVSQRMGADLRYDLFEKIIYFSEQSVDKIESGSLITRMTNDTSQVILFVNGIMRIFMKAPITCIGSIVFASLLNLRLSIIIYGIVAIVAFLIIISMRLSYPRYSTLQKAIDKVNSVVQEYFIGVRLVKAFGTYDQERDKFEDANYSLMEKGIAAQMIITLISPLMNLTVGIGTVIVIYVGSRLFVLNLANPGDITAFTVYMAQILTSLIMITNIFNTFVRTKVSSARIREVFECEGDFTGGKEIEDLNGDIEFENVTFAHFLAQQRNLGTLNGVIEENILGLKMVKAFGKQQDVLKQFKEINEKLNESSTRAQIWAGYMMPLMNVINNFIFTVTAIVGGILSVSYNLSVGTVVSFLNYSKQFAHPLNSIAGMFNTIQSVLAGAERVFEILDCEEEVPDSENAVDVDYIKGEVTFDNVCFSYNKSIPILKNVSFDVKAGEVVALVGETGAGKTTIVNLLMRFYDADSGRILIDGKPITEIKRNSLRKCFSVVLQDTFLFTGTIMDNIRYSKKDATDERVIEAAKIAHAHEFIDKLPNGYHTVVSGVTDNLSHGQRQLIAIARAVLSDSPILILDEATSSVDTKTEKDIQRALLDLMKNRTSFLIAHRLSTIRDADRIMVINDGKIIESGTHESLMNKKGQYYKMVVSQMGNMIS